ncbi:putative MFS family arabinose efflux permease [Oxalobacteraceae bacterium GrIS 1.11]
MHPIGPPQRRATRLVFLAAGLAMAAWAPLVPYAKSRLGLSESDLGLLLLCLGAGSLLAMPLTGALAARFGCRPVILASGALICLVLPGLAGAATPAQLGCCLMLFGAAIGTFDVCINIEAVAIEKASGGALMSGFHALFSVGGFAGAGSMALLLWLGLSPFQACLILVGLLAALLLAANPHLLRKAAPDQRGAPLFALPHGSVIILGVLCFIVFLAEGAILDWSALLLTDARGVDAASGGIAYAAFASAMTAGRFSGDYIVRRFGGRRVLLLGGLCAAAGFFLTVLATALTATLLGFVLIGLGAANLVPILFTAAGKQRAMPANLAVSAISTLGYAGILAGPAVIGFVAHASSLGTAFAGLGCALLVVAASSAPAKI